MNYSYRYIIRTTDVHHVDFNVIITAETIEKAEEFARKYVNEHKAWMVYKVECRFEDYYKCGECGPNFRYDTVFEYLSDEDEVKRRLYYPYNHEF